MSELLVVFIVSTELLLNEINNKEFKQTDIAKTYAMAIALKSDIDWPKVNKAIIERWSNAGLERVKVLAWKQVDDCANKEGSKP